MDIPFDDGQGGEICDVECIISERKRNGVL